jgi:hypothetical protein
MRAFSSSKILMLVDAMTDAWGKPVPCAGPSPGLQCLGGEQHGFEDPAAGRRLNGEPQTTSLIDAIRDTQFGKQSHRGTKASLTLGSWMNPQAGLGPITDGKPAQKHEVRR